MRENGDRIEREDKKGEGWQQAISHEEAQKPKIRDARRGTSCTGESKQQKVSHQLILPQQPACHEVLLPDARDSLLGFVG